MGFGPAIGATLKMALCHIRVLVGRIDKYQRRAALTGIGRQDRASLTTPSSRSPGDLFEMRYPLSA